jgi:hypothetical protein
MNNKKALNSVIYIAILTIIGILPLFIPISIIDYTKENWNGKDLAKDITGDYNYHNNTFYNFSEPNHLYVYDLRGKSYESQIALTTLQGLVNRDNTSIYLIYRSNDQKWLDHLNQTRGTNYTMIDDNSFMYLFQLFNNSIEGLILYDEDFLDTVNVATYLAGVYNCVVTYDTLLSNFSSMGISNIKYDLRNQFSSKIELYSWAWDNFNQHATRKLLCSLDPQRTFFRDYIVATKTFTFFLAGGPFGPKEEIDLFKQFLSYYPDNIPLFGWFTDPGGALGELESMKIVSKSGKYSLAAAVPDLTVLSSVKMSNIKQQVSTFDPSEFQLENKIYVSVVVSDGDNVNYCAERLRNLWEDPNRGRVPIGITLEPAMFKIFPTCLDYYYNSANNNISFLAGPSGAGYTFVDQNPAFPSYLNQTKYAMDMADMDQVWLLNGYEGYQVQYSNEVINAYTDKNLNFSGLFLNYADFPSSLNYISNNVPVFQSVFVERENELVGKLQAMRSVNPNVPIFVFVGFWAWDFTFTKVYDASKQLGDDFVFLRPDHLAKLYLHSKLSEESQIFNEIVAFILLGIIPLICALIGIIFIIKKNKKDREEITNPSPNEEKETTIYQKFIKYLPNISEKSLILLSYVSLILVTRMCLYSTILNMLAFVIFLISFTAGIYLTRFLEKILGVRLNLSITLIFFLIGVILFLINPFLSMYLGLPIGIIIYKHITNGSLIIKREFIHKGEIIYLITLGLVINMLVLHESYIMLLIAFIPIVSILVAILLYYIGKNKRIIDPEPKSLIKIKHWYPKGIFLGFLLFLLVVPTFAPDNLIYHLWWGVEFFPSRLLLSYSIASLYLLSILLIEVLKIKNIKISKKFSSYLVILAVTLYIFMPLFFNGFPYFLLFHFILIFSLLNYCTYYIQNLLKSDTQNLSQERKVLNSSISGFISQAIAWPLIGMCLMFIPASFLIADAQEMFVSIGVTSINQIDWPSFFWWIIYMPGFHMLLIIPIVIILLIYAAFELLYSLLL